MMFRDLSIKSKLRGINAVTGAVGLSLCFSAFLVYDYYAARRATCQRLESLATVVGHQSTAALGFGDAKAADEVLQALQGEPRIVTAALYGRNGALLARFARPGASAVAAPPRPPPPGSEFRADRLDVTHEISDQGERVGTVYVGSDLTELGDRLRRNGVAMLATFLGSSLVALLLCLRLEGSILRPILDLAGTMKSVSRTKDYGLRAVPRGRDETGSLVEGFNEMLAEIERRDDALRAAHATLEQRVAERTLELSNLNAALAQENAERAKAERVARESEERYRQLIDLSPDAVLIHADGRIVLANAAALRLLGADAPAALLDRPVLDLVAPEQRPAAAERLRLLQGGQSQAPQEQRWVRLDGSAVDVELAASPILLDGRQAAIVVVRDISQRKEVERLKNEFISTVSHELRTPLTSIRGSLGLLEGGKLGTLPPKAVPMVQIANSNCQRLVRLINDILDIEKIEAGKMEFSLRPVEIPALVQTAIEAAKGHADTLGVRLVLKSTLPGARASADPDRFLQVMANLLSNAAKFSPSPSTVEVRLERRPSRLRVSVRDRGSGIPEAFHSRIFQKFAQADGSDTRQKGGTGLGLNICKAIVERMGGSIGFDSVAGEGTTFWFELPELVEPEAGEPPADAPAILVVEDDHDVALLLSLMLRQGGYRPEVARDAAEAREKLARGGFAAVTLDIMLPDESGISFLRQLRREAPTKALPVVIVSAKAEAARRELAGSAVAVVDWIEKPIEPSRLMAAVGSALRRPSTGRPRILHVEDDAGLRELLRANVAGAADTTGASSLREARQLLLSQDFDLVVLDVYLPDGSGLDLLPHCKDAERRPVPVLVFSAFDLAQKAVLAEQIEQVLVKSRVSNEELREAIESLLRPARAVVEARP